jgi:hypothetical protein
LRRNRRRFGSGQFQPRLVRLGRIVIIVEQRFFAPRADRCGGFFARGSPLVGSLFRFVVEQQFGEALFLLRLLGGIVFAQQRFERSRLFARRVFARLTGTGLVRGSVLFAGCCAEQLLGQVFPGVFRIGRLFGGRAHPLSLPPF